MSAPHPTVPDAHAVGRRIAAGIDVLPADRPAMLEACAALLSDYTAHAQGIALRHAAVLLAGRGGQAEEYLDAVADAAGGIGWK